MMLRQEAALDHSIDRKVRILLRLRKESADLPGGPPGQDDGPKVESNEEIVNSDNMSDNLQSVGMVEDLKLKEQRGNVIENKGSASNKRKRSGNHVLLQHAV
jgi:hypothetical protein